MNRDKTKNSKRSCGCINHEIFCSSSNERILLRGKDFFAKRAEYNELLRRGLIDRRVRSLCTVCLSYGRRKVRAGCVVNGTYRNAVNPICHRWGELSQEIIVE